MSRKRFLTAALLSGFAVLILVAVALVLSGRIAADTITIYYSSTLDGHLDGCKCWGDPVAGLVKRARYLRGGRSGTWSERGGGRQDPGGRSSGPAAVRTISRENGGPLLVDTGNVMGPGEDPVLHEHIWETYAELGYDAVTIGNQEVSDGPAQLASYAERFPLYSVNMKLSSADSLPSAPLLYRYPNTKVGLIPLTGKEAFADYPRERMDRLDLIDPAQAISESLKRLKENSADIIVLLYHGKRGALAELLETNNGIDAVIFGHEELLVDGERIQGVPVFSPGIHGDCLGKLELRLRNGRLLSHRNDFLCFSYADDPDDPLVRKRIDSYENYRRELLAQKGLDYKKAPGEDRKPSAATSTKVSNKSETSFLILGAENTDKEIPLRYYYAPGCRECRELTELILPELARKRGIRLVVELKNILLPEHFRELTELTRKTGLEVGRYPVLTGGGLVLQADNIERGLSGLITAILNAEDGMPGDCPSCSHSESDEDPGPGGTAESGGGLSAEASETLLGLFPAVAAGLVDGVNPCAFAAFVFLLSSLSLSGGRRRNILAVGVIFTSTVFITYFALGLGLYRVLQALVDIERVAGIIHWLLIGVLGLLSIISIYDYVLIKKGRSSEIVMQLPGKIKERMRSSIRSYRKNGSFIIGTVVLAFLVTVFELGCTGQIYFPTLAYYAQTEAGMSHLLMLGIYNLAFILPLAGIFVISYFGFSSQRLSILLQQNLGRVKIITAGLFLGFAVLLLF